MRGFRYLGGVATLRLNREACIGCGRCIEVCPHQVFTFDMERVRILDLDACMECGACSRNCPVDAIRVDAGVGCATGLINEWLRARSAGNKGNGCCC